MLQTNHYERVRLPSVNDIFPSAHNQQQPHRMVYSTAGYIPTAIRSPIPITPPHQLNRPVVFSSVSPDNLTHHHSVSPLQNHMIVQQQHPIMHIPSGSNSPLYESPSSFQPTYYYQHQAPPQASREIHYNIKGYRIQKNSVSRQSNAWTYEDDCLLKYLKEVRNLGWREIAMHFQNRTANGCQFRWRRIALLSKDATEKNAENSKKKEDEKLEATRSNSLERILN